jgi:hypothetical protein
VIVNYNADLKRWYGPFTLANPGSSNYGDGVNDIGGKDYSGLWAVGQQLVGSGSTARLRGLVLQLK